MSGQIMISSRALVLHEIICGIDRDIEQALRIDANADVSELRAERKRRADECQYYLERAVSVKQRRKESGE